MREPTFCQSRHTCEQPRIPCPFCEPPTAPYGGMTIAFLATDLCDRHRAEGGQVVSVEELGAEVTP